MNIKRNICIAAITIVASAGISAPAMAFTPMKTISNGPVKPVVAWDHAAWKHCWTITYGQWRESGATPNNSATAADLTCGTQP